MSVSEEEKQHILRKATELYEGQYPQQFCVVLRNLPPSRLEVYGSGNEWMSKAEAIAIAIESMDTIKGDGPGVLLLLRNTEVAKVTTVTGDVVAVSDNAIESVYLYRDGEWHLVWGFEFYMKPRTVGLTS